MLVSLFAWMERILRFDSVDMFCLSVSIRELQCRLRLSNLDLSYLVLPEPELFQSRQSLKILDFLYIRHISAFIP